MANDLRRAFVWGGLTLLAANAIFIIWALAFAAIPHEPIEANLREAINARVLDARDYPMSTTNHFIDMFTECAAMSMALDPSNLTERAFGPQFSGAACRALVTDLVKPEPQERARYYRYWHGYSGAMKLGLWLFPFAKLRYLWTLGLLAAVIATVLAMRARLGRVGAGLLLVFAFACLTDWQSFSHLGSHTIPAILAFATFAAVVMWDRAWQDDGWVAAVFVSAGALMCYFDILAWAPIGLTLCVFAAWLVGAEQQRSPKALVKLLALVAVAWGTGYAGSFAIKQGVAIVAFPDAPVVGEFVNQLKVRLGSGQQNLRTGLFASTRVVLDTIGVYSVFSAGTTQLAFLLLVGFYGFTGHRLRDNGAAVKRLLLALVPAAIPLVWFEILANHTQVHIRSFTGRPAFLPVTVLACAALVLWPSIGRAVARSKNAESLPAKAPVRVVQRKK